MTPDNPESSSGGDPDETAVLQTPVNPASASTGVPLEPRARRSRGQRLIIEWTLLIGAALLIALVIKSFLFQAFYIPSESMVPTLKISDRVLVNKLSYHFHDVNRGDIVVFEAPECVRSDDIEDFVKRVIGLPGETITADADGTVLVNGRRLKEPYLPKGTITSMTTVPPSDVSCKGSPGSVSCKAPADDEPGCVVPPGTVLVLGDNRGSSKDGRVFGAIDQDVIVGRVFVRIWPIGSIGFL